MINPSSTSGRRRAVCLATGTYRSHLLLCWRWRGREESLYGLPRANFPTVRHFLCLDGLLAFAQSNRRDLKQEQNLSKICSSDPVQMLIRMIFYRNQPEYFLPYYFVDLGTY